MLEPRDVAYDPIPATWGRYPFPGKPPSTPFPHLREAPVVQPRDVGGGVAHRLGHLAAPRVPHVHDKVPVAVQPGRVASRIARDAVRTVPCVCGPE